ncbi:hypothetical protein [Dactylosporangium cerinum]
MHVAAHAGLLDPFEQRERDARGDEVILQVRVCLLGLRRVGGLERLDEQRLDVRDPVLRRGAAGERLGVRDVGVEDELQRARVGAGEVVGGQVVVAVGEVRRLLRGGQGAQAQVDPDLLQLRLQQLEPGVNWLVG